jgi:trk system potassium uptake protein TrkA
MAEKSFAVLGLGEFGLSMTKELLLLRQQVIAIDKSPEQIERIGSDLPNAFVVDSTKFQALKEGGVGNVDVAIIAFGAHDLQDALITTYLLSKLEVENIIVKLDNEEFKEIFKRVGATNFILPTRIAARSLAIKLAGKNMEEYYALEDHLGVSKFTIPLNFKPTLIQDLSWRDQFHINIIFVQKCTNFTPENVTINQLLYAKSIVASPQTVLDPGDHILVAGTDENLKFFSNALSKLKF